MKPRSMRRWAPALGAAAVLGIVGIAAGVASSRGSPNTVSQMSLQQVSEEPTQATLDSLADIAVQPSVTAKPKTHLKRTLRKGMKGSEVKRLQQRLVDLGYDPGDANGQFGQPTRTAVWAFEKLVMRVPANKVTGRVNDAMWLRMQDNLVVKPKRPKGTATHLEVYLPEQVAVLFEKNVARLITHISSGTNQPWVAEVTIDPGEVGNDHGRSPLQAIVRGVSVTPGGVYRFYRRYVDPITGGWREGRLGRMFQPIFFNKGIAVHGANDVPSHPASHGCIRIPMHIAQYFPDLVKNGDQVYVWDGRHAPEYYGKQAPESDVISRAPTTTSATTTIKPTTTVMPTTTTSSTTTSAP